MVKKNCLDHLIALNPMKFAMKIMTSKFCGNSISNFIFCLEIADTLCYLLVGTSEEEMHGVEVCLLSFLFL